MPGSQPVTGKMPVPQVLLLKWKHYKFDERYQSKGFFPLASFLLQKFTFTRRAKKTNVV
jgi:hypothetical protein